jgi:hypothetical protein
LTHDWRGQRHTLLTSSEVAVLRGGSRQVDGYVVVRDPFIAPAGPASRSHPSGPSPPGASPQPHPLERSSIASRDRRKLTCRAGTRPIQLSTCSPACLQPGGQKAHTHAGDSGHRQRHRLVSLAPAQITCSGCGRQPSTGRLSAYASTPGQGLRSGGFMGRGRSGPRQDPHDKGSPRFRGILEHRVAGCGCA